MTPLLTSYMGYTITVTHTGFIVHDRKGDAMFSSMASARKHVQNLRARDRKEGRL